MLRSGGKLYIKDIYFASKEDVSPEEKYEMAEFNRILAYKTSTRKEHISAISNTGFEKIRSCKLVGFTASKSSKYMITKWPTCFDRIW